MSGKTRTSQKIKYVLIFILCTMVLGFSLFYYKAKKFIEDPEIKNLDIDSTASMKLKGIETISKKNGITEWSLKASSAKLIRDTNKAVLKDVLVSFFTQDKKEVHVQSKNGVYDQKTHDISFSDNVIVTYEDFILRTEKLQYEKNKHIIVSKTHVVIEKANSVIEADSMVTKLKRDVTILNGNVKGNFSENFDPI